MQASDVMSSPVISIGPHTPVLQVAAILRSRKIGGVPVLADHKLVGIVTQKDLLHRHELGTDHHAEPGGWWERVMGHAGDPDRYIKSHGRRAHHVMTPRVIAVDRATPLREVTALFDAHRIGRAPVVSDGRMVGIVTCADLVQVLAMRGAVTSAASQHGSDAAIREQLLSELRRHSWWNGSLASVTVEEEVVLFRGFFENETQRRASVVAAENIEGVRAVRDERRASAEIPAL